MKTSGKIMVTIIGMACLLLWFGCAPYTMQQSTAGGPGRPFASVGARDTLSYYVRLSTEAEAASFKAKFESLLKEYVFDTVHVDTASGLLYLHVITQRYPFEQPPSQQSAGRSDRPQFSEESLSPGSDAPRSTTQAPFSPDAPTPLLQNQTDVTAMTEPQSRGGSVTMYTGRKSAEDIGALFYARLPISTPGDSAPSPAQSYFSIRSLTPRRIEVTLTDAARNCPGRSAVTAFDVINSWSQTIRTAPADGNALFPYVKGITGFIKGEEAIIQGFSVVNDRTINLSLTKDDPLALQRLVSSRLLGKTLHLGRLLPVKNTRERVVFAANSCYPGVQLLVDTVTVVLEDRDPIVSFSLNKYDICILYLRNDLEYAKRSLLNSAYLFPFAEDRYFLTIQAKDPGLRRFIKATVNPLDIQANAVKAEGSILNAIESDDIAPLVEEIDATAHGQTKYQGLKIVYNSSDPVSAIIAEKVFSDLSMAGITGISLKGFAENEFQKVLFDRQYDCAIGWTGSQITTDRTEQLRLAALWFGNETDESTRIAQHHEVPLFTVKRFALCRDYIRFADNIFAGLHRQP